MCHILCYHCTSCVLLCAQILPSIFAPLLGAAEIKATDIAGSRHGILTNAVVLILPALLEMLRTVILFSFCCC